MDTVRVAVFDAYGTLLDVHSAMARYAERLGPDWQRVSEQWRIKQIEYAWVRSLAGPTQHRDFAQLTSDALNFAAAQHGIGDPALVADIRSAYGSLAAYPDVPGALQGLKNKGIRRAILSNGEPRMLAESVASAGIGALLDAVLRVEEVGVFKPDPRVYQLACDRFGVGAREVAFFSSNSWDAFGAHAFGFRVFWVNRKRQPDEYGLREAVTELPGLAEIPALIG